jgi:hypothetical protein
VNLARGCDGRLSGLLTVTAVLVEPDLPLFFILMALLKTEPDRQR